MFIETEKELRLKNVEAARKEESVRISKSRVSTVVEKDPKNEDIVIPEDTV